MSDVRLDPQQVPARAELLLAAAFGEDAPGRPIYARPKPDDHDDGERAGRIKVGTVLTRRLHTAEATETPAGAAYGNPLRGRPERAPSVPVGSALLARTDTLDARGRRVYRVTPTGTVMYDEWIDDDPANGGLAVTRLRAAAKRSPEAALRRAVAGRADHAAAREVAEWLANEPTGRSVFDRRPEQEEFARAMRIAADPLQGRRDHGSRPAAPQHPVTPAGLTPEEARLRQNALMTAAHADPSRPVPILGAPRHQPAWVAVDPSTPTTHLDTP